MDERYSLENPNELQNKPSGLINLPFEILFRIFSFLPKSELLWNIGFTCQKLFMISCDILDHEISLGNDNFDQEQLEFRFKQLQKYKQVKDAIGYFFLGGGDSYSFNDNLRKVKHKSRLEECNDVTVVYNKWCITSIISQEGEDIIDGLRIFKNLKGLFIFRDVLYIENPVVNSSEVPCLSSISRQICDYLSTLNNGKLECLGLIGFEDDRICESVPKAYAESLKYIDMSQCRFSKNTILRLLEKCSRLEEVILYNVPDIKDLDVLRNLSNNDAKIKYDLVSPYWRNRTSTLREQFCKYGSCGNGVVPDQIVRGLAMDDIINGPEPLLALFMAAREWHSIR